MAKVYAMRLNGDDRTLPAKSARRAPGRGVKTILVLGLTLPTMRALGRLVGKHFYVQKVSDVNECLERVRSDSQVGGIVVNPGFSEIDAVSVASQVRKERPELPFFFYGSAQEIGSVSTGANPELGQYFKNPSQICKMAEAIVVKLSNGVIRPLEWHPNDTIVSKALDFIEANYQTIKKVEDISNHVGVSREHLSRQFTRFAGHKLSEFVCLLRIEKAKELLMEGVLVKQVFSQVGFRCSSSFFKAFLKHTGIAPSAYKDAVLVRRQSRGKREPVRGSFNKPVVN